MKISYFGIGNVSFISDEATYVADVKFQTKGDERLTGMQKISSHDIDMKVRIKGDRSWPFERIQGEILAEAAVLLGLAREHIDGATIESLVQYNSKIEAENDEENSQRIAGIFSKTT